MALATLAGLAVRFLIAAEAAPQDIVARSLTVVNGDGKRLLTVSDGKGGMILSLRSAEGDGEIRLEPLPQGGYFQISNKGWNLASIHADGKGTLELSDANNVVFSAPAKKP